jgi:hypothetical protein
MPEVYEQNLWIPQNFPLPYPDLHHRLLGVNDAVKVAMLKWRVPDAVAKKPVDVTAQIAKRAYELYAKRGRQDGRAVQDWEQAEHEIRKDQVGQGKPPSKAS